MVILLTLMVGITKVSSLDPYGHNMWLLFSSVWWYLIPDHSACENCTGSAGIDGKHCCSFSLGPLINWWHILLPTSVEVLYDGLFTSNSESVLIIFGGLFQTGFYCLRVGSSLFDFGN